MLLVPRFVYRTCSDFPNEKMLSLETRVEPWCDNSLNIARFIKYVIIFIALLL